MYCSTGTHPGAELYPGTRLSRYPVIHAGIVSRYPVIQVLYPGIYPVIQVLYPGIYPVIQVLYPGTQAIQVAIKDHLATHCNICRH